jgi:hypothetical protein
MCLQDPRYVNPGQLAGCGSGHIEDIAFAALRELCTIRQGEVCWHLLTWLDGYEFDQLLYRFRALSERASY